MASIPSAKQRLIVTGELAIDGSAGYQSSTALINFNTKVVDRYVDLAQIRCFGGFGYYTLLLDGSGSNGGVVVRAQENQGDPSYLPTAKGDQYSLEVASNTGETTIKRLYVQAKSTAFKNTFDGTPLLSVVKPNTVLTTGLRNTITNINLNSWRVGESMDVELGGGYGGSVLWSYCTPTSTSISDTNNYGSLSMKRNGTIVDNIKLLTDGSVEIPVKLTASTINATTYENLPPFDPTNLLPITLDNVSNRVGINKPVPETALDVSGEITANNGILVKNNFAIEMGAGISGKDVYAGKMWYNVDTDDLYIVGAGNSVRRIKLWDDVTINRYLAVNSDAIFYADSTVIGFLNLEGNARIKETNYLEFGTGVVSKEPNAGRVYYNTPTNELYIIGGGQGGDRTVKLWDHVKVPGYISADNYRFGDLNALTLKSNHSLAVGPFSGGNQGADSYAIGWSAGSLNQGITSIALGSYAGQNTQSNDCIAIGHASGQINQGNASVAIGPYCGQNTQGTESISIGYDAGKTSQGQHSVAIGTGAARDNQGGGACAIGWGAGQQFQSQTATAIGSQAAQMHQGSNSVAVGYVAGFSYQGTACVAVGPGAGQFAQYNNAVAIGGEAGNNTQGVASVAIGSNSGKTNQGNSSVAIGNFSGNGNQGLSAVALGAASGQSFQGNYAVAIGWASGQTEQKEGSVSIGDQAGNDNQGINSIAIGRYSGSINQGYRSIALGYGAGNTNQHYESIILNATSSYLNSDGSSRFYVKPIRNNTTATSLLQYDATSGEITYGPTNIAGTLTTAAQPNITSVGTLSVVNTSGTYQINGSDFVSTRNTNAVAIGLNAGQTSQGTGSTAIGQNAGRTTQGNSAIAVGYGAGNSGQGIASIAIGTFAGITNQHGNSIILNATGSSLNSDGNSRFYVKPIRNNTTATSLLQYDAATSEITYGPANIAGTLTTASQPNITSVGTLSSLTAGTVNLQSIANTTTTNVLYYDTASKAVTYGQKAPTSSSFWLASNTQVVSGESNAVKNLGSLTLDAGTYLIHVYGHVSGVGVTKATIGLGDTSTIINEDPKNGYPSDTWTTNDRPLQASVVVTFSSSTTLYLNTRILSNSLSTEYTSWVSNRCGIVATKLS